ncbi:MAG TPA: 23S rRNA pseudouridine(2604) synthase RluF [Ferruginibacter sp.]|nr:23S rRNA pseudouridine(2604) synthase RluF [Chitinophagaceae bacterium]HML57643.1 23S rRNA pseudouridine(2604) synthase RluF [Ferruginibacter sp.]HRN92275.1 23S rRNA pseudouridine(2604) synthase RluF [Ferruginibacter sp.]HRO97255.1 23S rRNA pseudouridine(2604) synthase RluF [Ferruginibacter sp.]HRP49874.1 23S rRNA pseudouridine(2604) synthase RluF [Ferruginibacter sp.]
MDISLNKFISDSGFCSRRDADRFIEECRVTINGKDAHKGNRVKEGDIVLVDGEPLPKKKKTLYLMLNKPKGITCTTDQSEKTNIIDFINLKQRIFPIGRLDKLSEGLIFLTNDGDIVNKILRSGNGHEKEYIVTVDKPMTAAFIKQMREGVRIPGAKTKPCFVKKETDTRFRIILKQGLNRQIRKMCEALGYKVTSLTRIRIMNITLSGLPVGKWRYFTPLELESIRELLKNSSSTAEGDGMGE